MYKIDTWKLASTTAKGIVFARFQKLAKLELTPKHCPSNFREIAVTKFHFSQLKNGWSTYFFIVHLMHK